MKKVILVFTIILIIISVLLGSGWLYYREAVREPLADNTKPVSVVVADNESLFELIDRLNGQGVLKDVNMIKLFYRISGSNLTIRPGRHEIPAGADLNALLSALKGESLDNISFTIPEGFTIENIALRIAESGLLTEAEFLKGIEEFKAPDYVPDVPERRYRMEGYLRPNTYTFPKGTSAEVMIREMSDAFATVMKALLKETGKNLPETQWDEVIVKASMIEREVTIPEERTIVASVIENRLKIDMRLQIDATVLYARGVDSKEITLDDLAFENPYNTYWVYGLPVGPISNPSRESIAAALQPRETDYIYYVANLATGRHFFTADYDEFLRKRDEYSGNAPILPEVGEPTLEITIPTRTVPENPLEGPVGAPGGLVPVITPQP